VIFKTTPAGLSYTVDGITYNSRHVFSWPAGSSHVFPTPSRRLRTLVTWRRSRLSITWPWMPARVARSLPRAAGERRPITSTSGHVYRAVIISRDGQVAATALIPDWTIRLPSQWTDRLRKLPPLANELTSESCPGAADCHRSEVEHAEAAGGWNGHLHAVQIPVGKIRV